MRFSTFLTAVAAYVSLANASPIVDTEAAHKPFTVGQIGTGRKSSRIGPVERLRTLKKFSAHVPEHVLNAATSAKAAAKQHGSVQATPQVADEEYLCPVQIGTPPQTLYLDFDTGSADLWVFSGRLPSKQSAGHKVYTINNSKSKQLVAKATWEITYGDNSQASGIVYYDKVVVGGVTATKQAVEAATSVSGSFISDKNNDGLLGLASSTLNTVEPKQVTTFFDTVKSTLPAALFTANLKHRAPGTYGFGFINGSEYTGAITYTPVTFANGFWEFTATGYTIGSVIYQQPLDAIADTGTTLIYMPDPVLANYYAAVNGAQDSSQYGGWVFPCSATLPTWGVTVGGRNFEVPAAYMNYAPVSATLCFGALQSSGGVGFDILGDTWLKSVFVVFDQGHKRLGVARKKPALT